MAITSPVSMSKIRTELGIAAGTAMSLGSTACRNLAGKPTGNISLSDFIGKSASGANTVNTMTFPNGSVNTSAINGVASSPNYVDLAVQTVSGNTNAVNLKFVGSAATNTGGGSIQVRKNGGTYQIILNAAIGAAPTLTNPTISFASGDTIQFRLTVSGPTATSSNRERTGNWAGTVSIQNTSDNNAVVGTFSGSGSYSDTYTSGGVID